jgi:endonuclease-3
MAAVLPREICKDNPDRIEGMQPAALFPDDSQPKPDPRLPEMHRLLLAHYGAPPPREPWDPLTQFIYSLLSSRTRTEEAHRVMRDLRRQYASWEELRDAPLGEMERAIGAVTFAEVKAPRLKAALQQITARYGSLTLDFLAKYRTEKIREWLQGFEGVGPQISAAVVNFSTLRRRALCVDANHLRVTQRLALTPRADAGTTELRLMRIIPAQWDAAMLDEHHSLVKLHAQTLCTFAEPRCGECPLREMCPHGKRVLGSTHQSALFEAVEQVADILIDLDAAGG